MVVHHSLTLSDYVKSSRLAIIAKPNARKTEVLGYDEVRGAVRIAIAAPPDDNKANKELLRFLKKELGKEGTLVSGATGRKKIVRF